MRILVKPLFLIGFISFAQVGCTPPEPTPPPELKIESENAQISYELGYSYAENIKTEFPKQIESDAFVKGIEDALSGSTKLVSDEQRETIYNKLRTLKQAEAQAESSSMLATGDAFLKSNGEREGVVTLPSGLQYEILEAGDGAKPTVDDSVTTHYEGTLVDGTVFDSSYERGQPATFPLKGVIRGWTEGLQLMKTGAKWKFFIPPNLAYGPQGRPSIPGNSTLIFIVELVSIESS